MRYGGLHPKIGVPHDISRRDEPQWRGGEGVGGGGPGTSPPRPKLVRAREHPHPVSQLGKPLPCLGFWGFLP